MLSQKRRCLYALANLQSRIPNPGASMAKLYFYYSAMNAGKTTTLLQSAHNYRERGMRTLILTPQLDDRNGRGVVASRIGLKASGHMFVRDDDLHAIVRDDIETHGPLDRKSTRL